MTLGIFGNQRKKNALGLLKQSDYDDAQLAALTQMSQAFAKAAQPTEVPGAGLAPALAEAGGNGYAAYRGTLKQAEEKAKAERLAKQKLAMEMYKLTAPTEVEREAAKLYPDDAAAQAKYIRDSRLGVPDATDGWLSVQGVGAVNPATGRVIGPWGSVGGVAPAPAQVQPQKATPAGPAVQAAAAPVGQPTVKPINGPAAQPTPKQIDPLDLIPPPPPEPVPRGLSPAGNEDIVIDQVKRDRDALAEINAAADAARAMITDLDNFDQALNRQLEQDQGTGGFLRKLPMADVIEAGLFNDQEIEMMASLRDKLTPKMRQGMPGSASNFDAQMWQNATVGPAKSPEVNQRISASLRMAAQNDIDKVDFYNAYKERFGTLRGADRRWNQYLEANPIFDPTAKDYSFNANRQSWQEWFVSRHEGASRVSDAPAKNVPAPPPGAVIVE